MSSREEIESSEEIMNRNSHQVQVKRTPKVKAPSMGANLKRLRVKFEETDDSYTIEKFKHLKDSTINVLVRYGFKEVKGKLVCGKVIDAN